MHSLVLLNGTAPGTTVRLDPVQGLVTIGRHASRELPLEDHRASRLHARVVYRASGWHLEDCDSLNGTYVNSNRVRQTVLEPGDLIRIGQRLILFLQSGEESRSPIRSSLLKSTTLLGKLPHLDQRGALLEQSLNDSMSQVVRDSAVLCRLANQLHRQVDTESLVGATIEALVDGIDADVVLVWLVGADGRLRCAGTWGDAADLDGDGHVLASLAVEKEKAFLIKQPNEPGDTVDDDLATLGAALSVPIPGQQGSRGAIECFREPEHPLFSRLALEFAMAVANQAGLALENLEHRERLEQANEVLRSRLSSQTKLAGSSDAMQLVLDQIALVGPTASTVLILGESGTGKELAAHSIHDVSHHRSGPYVAVNCAAFSDALLESELFGHEVGAFTGADRRRIGQFERAHRGTIFLDEVGEMSLACQAKLLRLLEGHPFERLGGHESIHVDVRVIAATHRNLEELVQQRRFREDLYYRLRVIDLHLPPLRERGEDVIELAILFLDHFRRQVGRGPTRLSAEAVELMRSYHWPGNVRELKNAVERAVVMGQGEQLQADGLGLNPSDGSGPPTARLETLREAELRHIRYVLEQVGGNKTQACRVLGIGRGTLYKKLEDLEENGQSGVA